MKRTRPDVNFFDSLSSNPAFTKYVKAATEVAENEYEYSLKAPEVVDMQWVLQAARRVQDSLNEETNVNGNFPVNSFVSSVKLAKEASKKFPNDIGVSNLSIHLAKMKEEDDTGVLNTDKYLRLVDFYRNQYPKSAATKVLDKIAEEGYVSLPVRNLIDISTRIASQEDFEFEMVYNGLNGNSPAQRKAREFVIALVNGDIPVEKVALDETMFDGNTDTPSQEGYMKMLEDQYPDVYKDVTGLSGGANLNVQDPSLEEGNQEYLNWLKETYPEVYAIANKPEYSEFEDMVTDLSQDN
jgi:hypothetical protein